MDQLVGGAVEDVEAVVVWPSWVTELDCVESIAPVGLTRVDCRGGREGFAVIGGAGDP